MKFIENAKEGQNEVWRLFISVLFVVCAIIGFGQMPFIYYLTEYNIALDPKADFIDQLFKIVGKNFFFILNLFPFIIGVLSLMFCVKFIHKRKILSLLTSRESFDWKRFWFSFGVWSLITLALFSIEYLSNSNQFKWNFNATNFLNLLGICIFILPVQMLFEELAFRGYLLQQLGIRTKKVVFAIVAQGLIFGAMHYSNPEMSAIGFYLLFYYIVVGIFLGLITYLDEGTELAIGFHVANNFIMFLLVTNSATVFQVDALFVHTTTMKFTWSNWLEVLVFIPSLVFLFHKVYKWKNWDSLRLKPTQKN